MALLERERMAKEKEAYEKLFRERDARAKREREE